MNFEEMDLEAPDFWDKSMGFDKLGLYYHVHMDGCEGENFFYSVYFEDELTDEKHKEAAAAVDGFLKPFKDKDIYVGYIDVSKKADKVLVFLDFGNSDLETAREQDDAVKGILTALNSVGGIRSVIINEGSAGFDF